MTNKEKYKQAFSALQPSNEIRLEEKIMKEYKRKQSKRIIAMAAILCLAVFAGGGGNVHIDPADGSVFMFDTANRPDRFQNIFYRIQGGIAGGFALDRPPRICHLSSSDGDDSPEPLPSQEWEGRGDGLTPTTEQRRYRP